MTLTHKNFDVVALGEAMVEFNQTKDQQPDEAALYLQGFGGDTSNAAIAAARAGARVAYLSRLGTDRWGERLMDLWQREHVHTATVLRDAQAPTGMYFVSHDPQGHHFSYARAGSAASRMQPQDLAHWGGRRTGQRRPAPAPLARAWGHGGGCHGRGRLFCRQLAGAFVCR